MLSLQSNRAVTTIRRVGVYVGGIRRANSWRGIVGVAAFGLVVATTSPSLAEPTQYTLSDIIELAIDRNPAIAGAQGVFDQSQGQQIVSAAIPNPSFTAQSGRGALRDPSQGSGLTEYGVTLSQPLEWPAKRGARQRVAEAGVARATVGMQETRLHLVTEVKTAFYELLLARQEVDLAKQNLNNFIEVARIVKARVTSGEAPQFESIKAEVEVLKAKQQVAKALTAERVKQVTLDTMTSGALGSAYAIQGDFASLPGQLDVQVLLARALDQHPTLHRLNHAVDQARRSVDYERTARVPNLTVTGGYWREIGREAVTGAVSVPTPLWYRQQGEIATAMGATRQAEAEWFRARNELKRAVNQHYQDARTAAELLDVYEKGLLKQAQEALRIARFSFQQGASSLLEVLDAQRVQRQLVLDYAQARFDLSISLVRLERAVGGPLS